LALPAAQRALPIILDEVHLLIENHGLRFILCGSSTRKLKRGHANLLGGRAWRYAMYPLVSVEVLDFNLLRAHIQSNEEVNCCGSSVKH